MRPRNCSHPRPVRHPAFFRWNPDRIVPDENGNRMVRWIAPDGTRFALGYARHSRLFGRRQRQTRTSLLLSMAYTVESHRAKVAPTGLVGLYSAQSSGVPNE